jgi:hypothetical protein
MYDDTSRLLYQEGDVLRWGDVYHMFKKHKFSIEAVDKDELKIFKNIRMYRIFRVASQDVVFPCTNTIAWILNNIDLGRRYVCNSRSEPIASF